MKSSHFASIICAPPDRIGRRGKQIQIPRTSIMCGEEDRHRPSERLVDAFKLARHLRAYWEKAKAHASFLLAVGPHRSQPRVGGRWRKAPRERIAETLWRDDASDNGERVSRRWIVKRRGEWTEIAVALRPRRHVGIDLNSGGKLQPTANLLIGFVRKRNRVEQLLNSWIKGIRRAHHERVAGRIRRRGVINARKRGCA